MAESTETSAVIQPVYGLVNLMNKMFLSLSGADALFEIEQHSQSGETGFYHYNCCGESDAGWGCAYRSLQTVMSCIVQLKGSRREGTGEDAILSRIEQLKIEDTQELPEAIPSIREIQISLDITKPKQWIDPDYAHTYLSNFKVKGRVEQVWSDKSSELELLPMRILAHFDKECTPVMIDDLIFAYTLVGCAKILAKPDAIFKHTYYVLVLDPHTTNKYVLKDYKSIIETQHRASYIAGDITELQVAGLKYAGRDVMGTDGVYWLPFDVMFSKGAHKQFKIYYPYGSN